ncbi:MAG: AAA family ATPase [Peptoniphilus sp.]|nr:AAA family ATPase [Peptoniphilus sp.]MDY3118838.1 AAA family ATPase [Peptoniphilus sp.]
MLFVLQGPSGSGKTTQANRLAREKNFEKIITATTRAPRPGEKNGKDYCFISDARYSRMEKSGMLLAPTYIHGAKYGIPKVDLLPLIRSNARHGVVVLDDNGARELQALGAYVIALRLDEKERLSRLKKRREQGRLLPEHFHIRPDARVDASEEEDLVYKKIASIVYEAVSKKNRER